MFCQLSKDGVVKAIQMIKYHYLRTKGTFYKAIKMWQTDMKIIYGCIFYQFHASLDREMTTKVTCSFFFQICFIETIKSWIFYGKLVSNDNKVQTAHTCLFYNRTSLIEQFYCFIVILHSGYIVRHWIPNAIRDRSTCNAWNIKINKLHCTIVLQTKTGVNAVYKL